MDSGEPLILIMMFFEMRKYRRLMVQIKSDDKMQLALRNLTDDRWIAVATRLAMRGSWPHSGTSVPARQVLVAAWYVWYQVVFLTAGGRLRQSRGLRAWRLYLGKMS